MTRRFRYQSKIRKVISRLENYHWLKDSILVASDILLFESRRNAEKVKNAIKFVPALWKDNHKDSAGLFYLWQTKLEILEEKLRQDREFISSSFEANEVKLALVLLDRINNADDSDLFLVDQEDGTLSPKNASNKYWTEDRNQDIEILLNLIKQRHLDWWR